MPDRAALLHRRAFALRKLGRAADALAGFEELVLEPSAGALRAEALTSLAPLVADPDWDGDGAPDAAHGLARPEVAARLATPAAFHAEWLERVGDVLADAARWSDADRAYGEVLGRFPGLPREAAVRAKQDAVRTRLAPPPKAKSAAAKKAGKKARGKMR